MANILRVTTPVQGQDNGNKIRQNPKEPSLNIDNIINPSRVPKNDGKTLYQDNQGKFSPNLKSNFDTFLQRMNRSGSITEETARLFFTKFGSIVNSGMSEGIAGEMAEYMEMMKVTEGELLSMLKGLQDSSIKFSGGFFDAIRNLIKSGDLGSSSQRTILEFLKRYDALTSTNHTLENMKGNLLNISKKMVGESKTELMELIGNLKEVEVKGNNSENLLILREKIIPMLAKYMSTVRDFGPIRENISLFVLNYANYEIGTKEMFSEALNNLLGISDVAEQVGKELITDLVENIYEKTNLDKNNAMQEKLVSIISQGLDGKAGGQNVQIFQNILNSALLNESVYMPLLHMMMPVEYNGQKMFSEVWVDPDENTNGEGVGNAVKLFIKFDIQSLGFFELIMLVQDKKVDMQIYYPEKLDDSKDMIRDGIFEIIERNDMNFRSYMADVVKEPIPVSAVFPKISEGRNVINVTA